MKKYLILSIISLFLLSCGDSYLDVNTDPNNPVEVSPDLKLPQAQVYTALYNLGSRRTNHLGNMLMYNWSETYGFSWYDEEFKYLVTPTFYDHLFDNAYLRPLKMYTDLDGLAPEYGYYLAISKIMKSYHFQILVDLYGDVPYSEASGRGELSTPKYDDAKEIYMDLIAQLTAAIELINSTSDLEIIMAPSDDDVMFGGDMDMWKQFANTVKLRILNRMSGVVDITAEIAVINAEGSGYITEDVKVNPGYLNEEGKQNPYWAALGYTVDGTVEMNNDATCATQYIIDHLTDTNDPRLDFLYEKPDDGHLGVNQGSNPGDDHKASLVSNIGPGHLKSATMGAVIFTLAESNFNQAEVALNGFGGDAEALYNAGVQASFEYLGVLVDPTDPESDPLDATAYLAQPEVNINYALSSNKLEAIITQKWLALNGIDAIQSWFDYNRTDYPLSLPVSLLSVKDDRPVRLFYPSSEGTGNGGNMPAQANAFTDKIFWAN